MAETSTNGYVKRWIFIFTMTAIIGLLGVIWSEFSDTRKTTVEIRERVARLEVSVDYLIEQIQMGKITILRK